MNTNPFQAPKADDASSGTTSAVNRPWSEAERMRARNLHHEASIKSIGPLFVVGTVLVTIGGVFWGLPGPQHFGGPFEVATFYCLLGMLLCWVAIGLRRLTRASRIGAGVLSAIGLIAFPFGTVINGYILYLLFSAKGALIFSDEYKRVIDATPHIRYRSTVVARLILGIFFVVVVLGIVATIIVYVGATDAGNPGLSAHRALAQDLE